MSKKTRLEILMHIKKRYKYSHYKDKCKILDEFVALTGYQRKHAIYLLNRQKEKSSEKPSIPSHKVKYTEDVKQVLIKLWQTANQICSKRLVPFIPELLASLERFGHLQISHQTRELLLSLSPATVDRMLKKEKPQIKNGTSTTCAGTLLKKQIKVRTFADWDDVVPGFMEGDLVAHCGDSIIRGHLFTLVLTDIASSWTDFMPILSKKDADVLQAIQKVKQSLPFTLLGLDTDNGSEFINYKLINYCKKHKITFTRSRAYKKNDQAHVEEKNGSIIRRLIGYDRYEGVEAFDALSKLYKALRLYINFFQPSLKLVSKTREGSKVTKKHDQARTPYQRLIESSHISLSQKQELKAQYEKLDPVYLLKEIEKLQNSFWQYACNLKSDLNDCDFKQAENNFDQEANTLNTLQPKERYYRKIKKEIQKRKVPYCRNTEIDKAWSKISLLLQQDPKLGAKAILRLLINEDPEKFNMKVLRTLQRKVARWKLENRFKE